jgi:hypothetical protein
MKKVLKALLVLELAALVFMAAVPQLTANAASKIFLLDSADGIDSLWINSGFDTNNYIEGTAAVVGAGAIPTVGVNLRPDVVAEFSSAIPKEQAYFEFYLYVEDIDAFSANGQIELNSSGSYDKQEFTWNIMALDLVNGWNYVSLKFSEAASNGADYAGLRQFRLYQACNYASSLKVDRLIITDTPTTTAPEDIKQIDKAVRRVTQGEKYENGAARKTTLEVILFSVGGALLALSAAAVVFMVIKKKKGGKA